jgi:hypothetical protein
VALLRARGFDFLDRLNIAPGPRSGSGPCWAPDRRGTGTYQHRARFRLPRPRRRPQTRAARSAPLSTR